MCLNHGKGVNRWTLYTHTHTHLVLNIKLCVSTTDPLYDKYSGLSYCCHFEMGLPIQNDNFNYCLNI